MSTLVRDAARPRHNFTVNVDRCRSPYDIYNRVTQRMRAERVPEIELARYFGAYIQTLLRHAADADEGFAEMLAMTRHWVDVQRSSSPVNDEPDHCADNCGVEKEATAIHRSWC